MSKLGILGAVKNLTKTNYSIAYFFHDSFVSLMKYRLSNFLAWPASLRRRCSVLHTELPLRYRERPAEGLFLGLGSK